MTSKTEIANKTLSKIGDRRVSNIETDPSERAQVINQMYDQVRDELLSSFPWNFAIKRVLLAKSATAPAWGYTNQYPVPADFLALLGIDGSPNYTIEDGNILTNEGAPLKIRYIRRIEDAGSFTPTFAEALSCELAVESVERISGSNTKKQILAQQRDAAIKKAYANDSIQNPPQELVQSDWISAREDSVIYDNIDYNA